MLGSSVGFGACPRFTTRLRVALCVALVLLSSAHGNSWTSLDGEFSLAWTIEENSITITMSAKTTGWIGPFLLLLFCYNAHCATTNFSDWVLSDYIVECFRNGYQYGGGVHGEFGCVCWLGECGTTSPPSASLFASSSATHSSICFIVLNIFCRDEVQCSWTCLQTKKTTLTMTTGKMRPSSLVRKCAAGSSIQLLLLFLKTLCS